MARSTDISDLADQPTRGGRRSHFGGQYGLQNSVIRSFWHAFLFQIEAKPCAFRPSICKFGERVKKVGL